MQHKFTPTTHLKRAALTLLALILTCATAWAQTTQSVTYIDENGQTQTVNATQITSDNFRMYSDRWYYVSGTVDISAPLRLMTENGIHNLILCDGATLTVSQVSQYNSKYAKLKVYGQSGGTGKLNVGNSSMMNAINNCDFALYGGEVTLTYYSSGHGINKNVDFNGGKLTATSGANAIGGNTTINATSGWIKASKYGGSVTIAEGKYMKDETGRCYKGTLTDAEKAAAAGKTLQPATQTEYISYIFGGGNGSQNSPYLIGSTESWNYFCDALQDNNTWNHFSGKTVKLGANIGITQSAGSAGNEFMGTFNGDGKTLTVDITETTTQGTAPFREIKGATIQNLVVTGSVEGTIHAAGLVGFARGADASTVNTITNCKVATNVTVTTPSGNNYHCGGVVGHAFHCTLNMSNTIYCGDITNSGNYVGGLQGWSDGNTINFSHCLFAGSYSGTTTGTASFHPVAVRYNNSATTADVSHVYYTVTPTLTNSNYIAADGTKTISRATAPATIGDQTQSLNFMSTNIYQYGICYNNLYYATIGLPSGGTDIYLIDNADDWLYFCEMLNDNDTWNRFSGKTVKLGADISVSRMAGNVNHDFCGTFDGQNNTLTFTATAADNYCAPFRYVQGSSNTDHAIIQNLNVVSNITAADYRHPAGLIALQSGYVDVTDCNAVVNINCTKGTNNPNDLYPAGLVSQSNNTGSLTVSGCTVSGTISTDGKYAAGMVGIVQSSASITNSVSSVTINSSTSGDGTHSGFVASLPSGRHLTIEGCVFNGKIVTTNGTTNCGGFLGHNNTSDGTGATITNCLYAPAADPNTVSTGCATFGRNVSSDLISNCYYTTDFNDGVHFIGQGKQARSITAGDYVTVENAGTATTYSTSGITSYGTGILYDNVLYAGNGDEVSLTLAHQDREGYDFVGYTATAGNLNGSSLTMPDGNVTINAEYTYTAPSELTVTDITFTTATLNWNGFQESYSVRYRTVGANEWQTIGGIAATTTTLSGLLSGTTYEWQVQGLDCDGNGGTTEWSATATFNTLSPCEVAPSELTATDITATTATLNWNGSQESYNVRYHPAIVIFNEGFESGTMPDGWTRTGAYWQVTSGTGNDSYTGAATGNYNAGCYIEGYDVSSDILITPVMDLSNVASATLSFNFWNTNWAGDINILKVYYRVDEGEWQSLYTYENATEGWIPVTINLEGLAANYQIGFECEGHYSYGMGIDDVKVIGIYANEWTTVTNVSSPHDLTGLTPETQYLWQVQGLDCNGEGSTTEWSVAGTFTTLSPCEVQPSELTATDITFTTATLNWNGLQENYSVRYRTLGANEWQTIGGIAATTTTLSGLLSGTTYEWQVQGLDCNSEGSTTEWSEAGTFTTLNPCEAPSELTATDITATTTTLNWNGLQESYSVRYRPVILYEGFESGTMPDGWTRTNEYWEVTSGTGHLVHKGAATGNYNAGCYTSYSNDSDILITPVMDLGNVASATLSFNFWNTNWDGDINILKVHYRVNGGEWQSLYTYENATEGWIPVTINLEGMAANYQIGFECEGHYSYGMGIDDVMVTGINTSEWTTVTNVSSPHNLTGLTPETQYLWQVQGLDCNGEGSTTEWSVAGIFTTLLLPLPVSYIDENGETQQCTDYLWLTGTETTLGAAGQETWYVVDSDVSFTDLTINGDIHLILVDGKTMNLNHEQGFVTLWGQANLTIYGQTNGTGTLSSLGLISAMNITINGGIVNVKGDGFFKEENYIPAIWCVGDMVINGGKVYAQGDIGIVVASMGAKSDDMTTYNFTLNGGQVTAIGMSTDMGIIATGNITLGWTNPTDYIYANSYYAADTLSIASGKTFIDDDGNPYSGIIAQVAGAYAIDGKTLYPYIEGSVPYLDMNGRRQLCTEFTTLDGSESTLTAGWYVADGTLDYDHTITLSGDIHLILKDNAVMNVTSTEGYGFDYYSSSIPPSISIYAQSTGESKGQLHVDASVHGLYTRNDITINGGWVEATSNQSYGIFASSGNVIINGGIVEATGGVYGIFGGGNSVEIHGGEVTAIGPSYGINAQPGSVVISGGKVTATATNGTGIHARYSITISGGQVTANGRYNGIYTYDGIILGWTNASDFIYASSFYINNSNNYITLSKAFIDEDGQTYSGTVAKVSGAYAIDGKTLYPDCVVMKQVAGYEEGNGGWVFIASPVAGSIAPSEVHNLFPSADETTDDYDLYHFNQAAELEWENWKATGNDPDFTTLVNGQGYLYATKNTKTLVFTGPFITDAESVAVGLEYDATDDHKCWNLVGNPFADTAYVDHDFYVMNALGSEIIAAEREYVNPMEGIFVKAEGEYDDTMIFSLQAPCKGQSSKPKHEQMVINLSRDRGPSTLRVASGTAGSGTTIIDRAIVRMGEGQTQPKFQINRNSTKLYIPQGGTDYAVITSNGQGELPLNFKAETDGTYTITVDVDNVEMAYLHLIDNMTGADVDLLSPEGVIAGEDPQSPTPSYTFTAKTTDYESRFKLVFSTNDADDTSAPSTGSETEGSGPDDVRTQKMVIE